MLVACATLMTNLYGPRPQIKVPHELHKKAEVDCLTCHETIFDSKTLTDQNKPKEETCLQCHKKEREANNCQFCHIGEPAPYAARTTSLVMSHADHLERNEDCGVCHKTLPQAGKHAAAPSMDTCTSCHVHKDHFDNGRCDVCHKDLGQYGLKPVSSFSHRGDFLHTHGREARSTSSCSTCHDQSFCSDCHTQNQAERVEVLKAEQSVDRSFIHPADFLGRHSVDARANSATCQRCHGTSTCQSCHLQRGLASGGTAKPGQNPHPDGYGAGDKHGPAARRDILSCASCHDQGAASICVDCHKVGGVGGNPHPKSWSLRHDHQEIGRNAMCIVCHQ
jgi:hypothetical protein